MICGDSFSVKLVRDCFAGAESGLPPRPGEGEVGVRGTGDGEMKGEGGGREGERGKNRGRDVLSKREKRGERELQEGGARKSGRRETVTGERERSNFEHFIQHANR